MNGTRDSLDQIKAMAEGVKGPLSEKVDALICPPSTLLYVATALCDDSPLLIGAQDCHAHDGGAHTGCVSAGMIREAGAKLVITADEGLRGGKRVPLKKTVDRAIEGAAHVINLVGILNGIDTVAWNPATQTVGIVFGALTAIGPSSARKMSPTDTTLGAEVSW